MSDTARRAAADADARSGVPSSKSPASPRSAAPWVVLLTVVAMTFMSTLDSSIVNVALPSMQRELAVGASDIQAVSSIYLLVCCATVLVFGRLGDLWGKVRLFQAGVALFTVGSALCCLSQSLPALICARAVQGLGASCATANNMGIVTEAFPASQRGRALGIVSTFVSLGMMCGPTIGGALVAVFPWEAIFAINVPIGILSFFVGQKTLPRRGAVGRGQHMDVAGSLTLTPAILFIYLSLTGLASGANPALLITLAVGLVLLAAFICVERKSAAPLVALDVFANPNFTLNLAAMFLCFFAVGGTELILPFYLQDACGFPSGVTGLALTAIPLAMAVAGPVGGAVSDAIGSFWPCLVGMVVYSAGIFLVGDLDESAGLVTIVALMAFMAAGTGLFQSPNNSLVMGSVETDRLGFAGSLVSLVRYLGMSCGVTGGTALLYGKMGEIVGESVSGFIPGQVDAFLAGFAHSFTVMAALCLLGAAFLVVGAISARRRHAGR